MGNFFYIIYVNSNFIEGICLTKNSKNFKITNDIINFVKKNTEIKDNEIGTGVPSWIKTLEIFLDTQKWKDHPIAFILPSEEIIFRKINFPFQDKKKVEQALPFELKEELIFKLSDSKYSTKVQPLPEQKSEAIVLLIEKERLKQLQKICFDRDLLIRNVDCSSYALFRSKILFNSSQNLLNDFYQVYLGSDEAFVNTIKNGSIKEIKIFPNRIPEILQKNFLGEERSLHSFISEFVLDSDNNNTKKSKFSDAYLELKEEIHWLCNQFTLHLKIKNFNSESKIETYGVFGPLIKWNGLLFNKRTFPLPELSTFAERCNIKSTKSDSFEKKLNPETFNKNKLDNAPNTLQELMEEAKQRETSNEKTTIFSKVPKNNFSKDQFDDPNLESSIESVNPKDSILSLIERKHWSILGDLRKKSEIFFQPHILSLFHESTPWRIFLKRNKVSVTISGIIFIIIVSSFFLQKITKYNLLKNEVYFSEIKAKSELKKVLPEISNTNIDEMLNQLREKINNRKYTIESSKKFEKREYKNLNLLKNISIILDKDAIFQVDSIELTPDRFSISGTIDSYERLQIFKKRLEEIDYFFGKKIIENNRKSPNGIIFRILIEF